MIQSISLCEHGRSQDVGQTMWLGFPTTIYWCPSCGNLKANQTSGSYKSTGWMSPSPETKAYNWDDPVTIQKSEE